MFKQYINERQMCYKARRQSLILYIIGPSQLDIEYVYIINKTDRHDITEILLKVALNTIKQAKIVYVVVRIQQHFQKIFVRKQKYMSSEKATDHP